MLRPGFEPGSKPFPSRFSFDEPFLLQKKRFLERALSLTELDDRSSIGKESRW